MEGSPGTACKRILIVDDDALTSLALMKILEAEDRIIETVTRGPQAFDKIRSKRYDLVFLEIGLFDQAGIAFLKEIGISDPAMRIVVTSASVFDGEIESAVNDNDHFFLPKPFDGFMVKALVTGILKEKGKWEGAFQYSDNRAGRDGAGKFFKEV